MAKPRITAAQIELLRELSDEALVFYGERPGANLARTAAGLERRFLARIIEGNYSTTLRITKMGREWLRENGYPVKEPPSEPESKVGQGCANDFDPYDTEVVG